MSFRRLKASLASLGLASLGLASFGPAPFGLGVAVLAVSGLVAPVSAHAGADFDPANVEWNGGARLLALGRELGLRVEPATVLALGALTPRTALLFLGPRTAPPEELRRFVRAGGRLAIADDVGAGAAFFARYGLQRLAEPAATMGLGGLAHLALAYPRRRHMLTWGIDSIATNHPAALRAPGRVPLLAFSGEDGFLHALHDGDGELLALSDPSVLTNQMLPFADNEHFAVALLRYLTRGTKARRLLVFWGNYEISGVLPPVLGPRGSAASLADGVRALSEEGAFGVNSVAFELLAQRPVGGILMALAVFACGGALLLFAAVWGGSLPLSRNRDLRVRTACAPSLESLGAGERARLGAALRRELEARLGQSSAGSARGRAALLATLAALPQGEADPLAHRVSARRLRQVLEQAENVLGPLTVARPPEVTR